MRSSKGAGYQTKRKMRSSKSAGYQTKKRSSKGAGYL